MQVWQEAPVYCNVTLYCACAFGRAAVKVDWDFNSNIGGIAH